MKSVNVNRWRFIVLPCLAMSVGWGLRGQLGHSTGAMVPGVLVVLTLCGLLPGKLFSRGLAVGLGAIAFGYGATITTQDTAQLADGQIFRVGNTMALDYTGLAIKGAVWAMVGGAVIGLAFVASRYRWRDIVIAMAALVVAFPVGWALINKPRPVYFSVTRHESYGGYLVGCLVLLAWLTFRGRTKVPLVLAACAAVAGGVGFPLGVFLNSLGLHSVYVGGWHDWWKVAETTYGAFMGIGLGIGTWLIKDKLPDLDAQAAPALSTMSRAWGTLLGLGICAAFVLLSVAGIGEWLVPGSIMVCAVCYFPKKLGWHLGITVTIYVTAVNVIVYWLHEQKIGNAIFLWTLVAVLTAVASWAVTGWWNERDMAVHKPLLFLMWTIVALTALKTFIEFPVFYPDPMLVLATGSRWLYTVKTWGGGLGDEVILGSLALLLTLLTAQRPLAVE
jgi:hypothetical protein